MQQDNRRKFNAKEVAPKLIGLAGEKQKARNEMEVLHEEKNDKTILRDARKDLKNASIYLSY